MGPNLDGDVVERIGSIDRERNEDDMRFRI